MRAQQSPLAPVQPRTRTRGLRYICCFTKTGDTSQVGGARGVAPLPGQPYPGLLLGAVAVHIAGRTRLRSASTSAITRSVTSRARQRVQKLNTVSLLPHLT